MKVLVGLGALLAAGALVLGSLAVWARDDDKKAAKASAASAVADVAADMRRDRPLALPKVACDRTYGPNEKRIQVVYAYVQGQKRIPRAWEVVQRLAWGVNQTLDSSARRQGGALHFRFAVTKNCRVAIQTVALRPDQLSNAVSAIHAETARRRAAAEAANNRRLAADLSGKQMILLDSDRYPGSCVGAGGDAVGGGWGLINQNCGLGELAWTHEIGHGFGLSHCHNNGENGNDPMCRNGAAKCKTYLTNILYDSCRTDDFRYLEGWAASPYTIKKPTPVYKMRLASTTHRGKCVGVARGGRLASVKCDRNPRLVWQRVPLRSGFFGLRNAATKQCAKKAGKAVRMTRCNQRDLAQHWWFDGYEDSGSMNSMNGDGVWNLSGSRVVFGSGSGASGFKQLFL